MFETSVNPLFSRFCKLEALILSAACAIYLLQRVDCMHNASFGIQEIFEDRDVGFQMAREASLGDQNTVKPKQNERSRDWQ